MSDNQYIKKQQRVRARGLLTTRNIFSLIFLSVIIYAGFYFEYGDIGDSSCEGACENTHSYGAMILGFLMIFLGVIAAGGIVGAFIAFLKWSRGQQSDALSTFTGSPANNEGDGDSDSDKAKS